MDLILIRETTNDSFLGVVKQLRKKAEKNPPLLDDITKEVELVRAKRYAKERK